MEKWEFESTILFTHQERKVKNFLLKNPLLQNYQERKKVSFLESTKNIVNDIRDMTLLG